MGVDTSKLKVLKDGEKAADTAVKMFQKATKTIQMVNAFRDVKEKTENKMYKNMKSEELKMQKAATDATNKTMEMKDGKPVPGTLKKIQKAASEVTQKPINRQTTTATSRN